MKPIDDTDIVPQIYFSQKHSLPIKKFTDNKLGTNNYLTYVDSGFNQKNSHFNVQEDFSLTDMLKFMDYCFTSMCWGALNIRLMKHLPNHYYSFPCQNSKCQNAQTVFYLLPTKSSPDL